MQVQIKEDINNKLLSALKNINVRIPEDKLSNMDNIIFSFIDANSIDGKVIKHSYDSDEGTFLNYGDSVEFNMTINLPSPGTYSIKVVACELGSRVKQKTIVSLDDDGNAVEEVVDYDAPDNKFYESLPLSLTYGADEWT